MTWVISFPFSLFSFLTIFFFSLTFGFSSFTWFWACGHGSFSFFFIDLPSPSLSNFPITSSSCFHGFAGFSFSSSLSFPFRPYQLFHEKGGVCDLHHYAPPFLRSSAFPRRLFSIPVLVKFLNDFFTGWTTFFGAGFLPSFSGLHRGLWTIQWQRKISIFS